MANMASHCEKWGNEFCNFRICCYQNFHFEYTSTLLFFDFAKYILVCCSLLLNFGFVAIAYGFCNFLYVFVIYETLELLTPLCKCF
jgi:hypothetical protein